MPPNNNSRLPTIQELKQFAVNQDNAYEVTRQTLYDTQTYLAAGQTILTFFQDPVGQAGKTKESTNMESAGQLPNPKHFLVESIEILFFPGVNPVTVSNTAATDAVASEFTNDVYTFQQSGFLDFFIGSKSYLTEAPLGKFPAKTRLDTEMAAALQINQASAADEAGQITLDYATMAGRPYFIDPQITLVPTQNFNITLNWSALQALPSGQDATVVVSMDGLLYRLSQ